MSQSSKKSQAWIYPLGGAFVAVLLSSTLSIPFAIRLTLAVVGVLLAALSLVFALVYRSSRS
jgi:hypothetical protein